MDIHDPSLQAASAAPEKEGWLKVDFHLHTAEDPADYLEHSAEDLLRRAHALGFHALAITLHDHVLEDPAVFALARELGIRLIPGAELRLQGADVVIVNLTAAEARGLRTLDDLRAFRQRRGASSLIIAPHPYFVLGSSLGGRLVKYIDVFDAIEISHFHTRWFDRNRPAIAVAEHYGKPLLATSDAHRLRGFGHHFSFVQAPADAEPEAIFDAIRSGCVRPVSPHLSAGQFLEHLWWITVTHEIERLRALRAKRG